MLEFKTSEEAIKQVLSELSDRLGLDVSENSYTSEFVRIILSRESNLGEKIRSEIEKKSGRSLLTEELDQLYGEIFGIPRMALEENNYKTLSILNESNVDIVIPEYQVFKVDGAFYSTKEEKTLSKGITTNINVFLDLTIFEKTVLSALSQNVLMDDYYDPTEGMTSFLTCVNVLRPATESDEDYKIRCQTLTQNYSFNNIQKIKSVAKAIPSLLRLDEKEDKYSTSLTIIPKNMDKIKEIRSYIEEIVDYFQGSKISVLEPTVTQIDIEGLMYQLQNYLIINFEAEKVKEMKEEVFNLINSYITGLNTKDIKVYEPKQVELILNRFVVENNLKIVPDESLIKHKISLYSRGEYTDSSLTYYLDRKDVKTITTDLTVLKLIQ